MNNFQKSKANQILSMYKENDIEKGGKGSGRHKINATIDVVRDSQRFPHSTVGVTSSGKHVSMHGKFIDKTTKQVTNPDEKDLSEAQEMYKFHHDRLTGGTAKADIAKQLKKSEDNDLEKGGKGSGVYDHHKHAHHQEPLLGSAGFGQFDKHSVSELSEMLDHAEMAQKKNGIGENLNDDEQFALDNHADIASAHNKAINSNPDNKNFHEGFEKDWSKPLESKFSYEDACKLSDYVERTGMLPDGMDEEEYNDTMEYHGITARDDDDDFTDPAGGHGLHSHE